METIYNAIIAGTQSKMTYLGVEFNVPVLPAEYKGYPKKQDKFAREEAEKMYKIICE